MEDILRDVKRMSGGSYSATVKNQNKMPTSTENDSEDVQFVKEKRKLKCANCSKEGHYAKTCDQVLKKKVDIISKNITAAASRKSVETPRKE